MSTPLLICAAVVVVGYVAAGVAFYREFIARHRLHTHRRKRSEPMYEIDGQWYDEDCPLR